MNKQRYNYFVQITDYMNNSNDKFLVFKDLKSADTMLNKSIQDFLKNIPAVKNCRAVIGLIEDNKTFANILHIVDFVPIGREFYPIITNTGQKFYPVITNTYSDKNLENEIKEKVSNIVNEYKPRYEYCTNYYIYKLGIPSFFIPYRQFSDKKNITLDKNMLLCPNEEMKLETAIEEVYIKGEGWKSCDNLQEYKEKFIRSFEYPVIEKVCAQCVNVIGEQKHIDMSVEQFLNQSYLQDGKNCTVYCNDLLNKAKVPIASFDKRADAIGAMHKLSLPYCDNELSFCYDKENMMYFRNNEFTRNMVNKNTILVSKDKLEPYKQLFESSQSYMEKKVTEDITDYLKHVKKR